MKTFIRQGLLLSFLGLQGLASPLAHAGVPGPALESEIDFSEAQSITGELLNLTSDFHFIGEMRSDTNENRDLFEQAENLASALLNQDSIQVKTISSDGQQIRLEVTDPQNARHLYLSAIKESAPASKISTSSYMLPATQLIIEESSRWENTNEGYFTAIRKTQPISGDESTRAEFGVKRGPFSIAVFGGQAANGIKGGITSSIRIETQSGWNLSLIGMLTENIQNDFEVAEGRYQNKLSRLPDGFASLQIDRSWGVSQIKTTAGVNFFWKGGDRMSAAPTATFFIGIGKSFKDKRGRERGSLQFLGTTKAGNRGQEWFLGIQASLSF
jgi:hypothetical protein